MTDARWARIREIFTHAEKLPADQRKRYLDEACDGDAELRQEIEELLASSARTEGNVESIVGEAASKLSADHTGRIIGPYRVLRVIGQGGMGQVYLAERVDDELDQQVAIKVVGWYAISERQIERFIAERQILANLDHPHIARLVDGGRTEDGVPYLAMEFVDGQPITRYADRAKLSLEARVRLFLKVCDAVQHAHGRLVIHRDIKPSNILVSADGTPKLLDFGIAKLMDSSVIGQQQPVTRAGLRVMTPEYASPEQLRGLPVTTQTDVYGLGLLLYELLTGRFPYDVDDPASPKLEQIILESDPGLPSVAVTRPMRPGAAAGPTLPATQLSRLLKGDLDNVVMMALRKEPERRYATVKDLADDLRNYLADRPVAARGDSAAYRTSKFVRRNRTAVAVSTAVLAAIAVQTTFYTIQLAEERDRAQLEARRAEEVATFLTDLFAEADPAQNLGDPLTARQMLDLGAARISDELDSQPELQAALMLTIGQSYGNMEENVAAREYLEAAVPDAEAALGKSHPEVLKLRRLLAMSRTWVGDAAAAQPVFEENLELAIALYGPNHLEVARERRQLGVAANRLGDYESAETQFQSALAVLRTLGKPAQGELARTLLDYGSMLRMQDRYTEQETMLLEALAIQEQRVGRNHPEYSAVVNNLGNHYFSRERLAEARRYMSEHLALQRELHGDTSVPHGIALVNYSSLLKRDGELEESLALCEEALGIFATGYGTDAPRYAYLLENIANIQTDLERYADAEQSFRQALDILEARFGADHPEYAFTQRNWGVSLQRAGRADEAIPELSAAIDTWIGAHGENYSRVITTRNSLAQSYRDSGDLDAARLTIDLSLRSAREVYPEPHIDRLFATRSAAGIYADSGDRETADSLFLEAIDIANAIAADNLGEAVATELRYAEHLAATDRIAAARERLQARRDALSALDATDQIARVEEALAALP